MILSETLREKVTMLWLLIRKYFVVKFNWKIILLGLMFALSACGGGGGGNSATPPTPQTQTESSDWDSLVWDDDNWG